MEASVEVLRRPLATLLQNNMVQTTGSRGESIVAGMPEERDGPRADSGLGVLIASSLIAGNATGAVPTLLAIPVYAVARSRRLP